MCSSSLSYPVLSYPVLGCATILQPVSHPTYPCSTREACHVRPSFQEHCSPGRYSIVLCYLAHSMPMHLCITHATLQRIVKALTHWGGYAVSHSAAPSGEYKLKFATLLRIIIPEHTTNTTYIINFTYTNSQHHYT